MTSALRRVASVVVLAIGTLATASYVNADTGIVVTGKALEHDRSVVSAAVSEAARKASWTIDGAAFKPNEIDSVVKCLQNDRPWPCIEPTVRGRHLDRLLVVQVDLKAPNTPAITAQLVFADDRIPPEETRFCEKCTDVKLTAAVHDLMKALVRRASESTDSPLSPSRGSEQTLIVTTTPPGAWIWIDGRKAGRAGDHIALTAGRHTIEIELAGHRRERRTVDTTGEGEHALAVELRAENEGTRPTRTSKALPIGLMVGGSAIAAGGIIYGLTLDPPSGRDQERVLVSWPAVGGVALGAVAVGAGLYLLLRRDDRPRSVPTAAVVPGGAFVGWSGSFD